MTALGWFGPFLLSWAAFVLSLVSRSDCRLWKAVQIIRQMLSH